MTIWRRLVALRVARFFVVSSGSTAIDYMVLFTLRQAFSRTTSWLAFAIAVGYVVGTVINFFWARRWVFNPTALNPLLELTLVAIIAGTGLALTEVVTLSLNKSLGWPLLLAKTIAVVSVFFCNFVARRVLVYRTDTIFW